MKFIPGQQFHLVFLGEARDRALLVSSNAAAEIARYTDIKRAVALTGENVYGRNFLLTH